MNAQSRNGGEHEVDVVVIGAGPAGEVLAGRLASAGKAVAIVEGDLVGGECAYYACMPSKALLRAPELLREVGRVPGAAEALTGPIDVSAVLERRNEVVHDLHDDGQLPWLEHQGIELVRGHGRLDGERRVRVGDRVLRAREAVVIAVGSGSLLPPIPGLREARTWSNREVTTADSVPRRLGILGGGVVGVEMAQAWQALGAQVTVIEALDGLLYREEPFAGELVGEALRESGVEIRLGAKATGVSRDDAGVTIELEHGPPVSVDELLVAIGRHPLTDDLGLDTVGLEAGKKIEVDASLRVPGLDWLYAIGDVNGRALLTHMGKYQAVHAANAILGGTADLRIDGALSPRVVFTDPQVAAVGHTLKTATEAGLAVREIDLGTGSTAGASFIGRNAPGTTRFVVDTEREVLVGATFVGVEVSEFVQAATIAVVGEVPMATLAHAVPAFPTRSELWLKFTDAYAR